jgi:hypothetical protein
MMVGVIFLKAQACDSVNNKLRDDRRRSEESSLELSQ